MESVVSVTIVLASLIFFATGFDLRTCLLGLIAIALLSLWIKLVRRQVQNRLMDMKTIFSVENLLFNLPSLPY